MRIWAFWRRLQYILGFFIVATGIGAGVYYTQFYESATCFDNNQNGEERGVDCGGACTRVCSFDVLEPETVWSQSFRVTDGWYNAVAYIENKNINVGIPQMRYTFSLYDTDGLITERSGTAVLPPDNVTPIFEGRINTGTRIPTQTFVTIETDAIWLPAEIGREQFTVTSRRLVSADSKPRLDAEMRNTSVAEARDVEIVATIFDRAGNALTASRTIVPIFEGHANENVVFTWPEPIAKTVRSCEVPTDVVLAIDVSGSMNDDGGTPPEPITSVLSAAEAFVGRLGPNDQVAIVTYATDAALPQVLTSDKNLSANVVANLSIAPASETGSTNTGDAIILTNDEINSARHNQNARKVLVLLTDGRANAPGETPEEYAQNAATALKETDVEIYTIGLGDTVNEAFLESIASDSSNYFRAVSVNTINQIYSSITAEICEDGAAVIEIIPKTATSFAPLQ